MAHDADERPRGVKPGELETTEPLHGKLNAALFGQPVEPEERPGDAAPDDEAEAIKQLGHVLTEVFFGEPTKPAEPNTLGRFVILACLGKGGMGVVYSAYDPELNRRVALKVLRAKSGEEAEHARVRLQREAQALARLTHPNVVPVYDVGVIDGQVFIVMELVRGQTLRQWANARQRSWREILDVYLQAGDGLAAAHAVGLVHRDFKPDNALIGKDGRVRVADFGLVRGDEDSSGRADVELDESWSHAGASSADELELPLTSTGVLVGTPAYMSPEQFTSAEVGPATDQFSFCVSLYEALYGERPFAGSNLAELTAAVRAGKVREPARPRTVPGWIQAVVLRGLAVEPRERFPSMTELVAALRRDPARARRRWLVALALAVLTSVSIYLLAQEGTGVVEVCQGGPAELARIWNQERRDRVARALRSTGRAYADAIAPRVLAGLDRYGAAWTEMRHEACMSHQRGDQSSDMLDRRMRCLDGRFWALDRAITVIEELDAGSLGHVAQVVERLPSLPYCADREALAAEVPPPEDAALAARVQELRSRLRRVDALESAGRYSDALAAARAMAGEAGALGHGPVEAEALLAEGRSAMMIRSAAFVDAIEPLRRAAEIGIEHRMSALAVEALARRFYVQAMQAENPAELQGLIPVAEAMSKQVADRGFARTLLLNNVGVVYMTQGDRERARRYFEQALEELERAPEVPLELTSVRKNLAMLTPDVARRAGLMQQELERLERTLGESHPWTLELRISYAHYTPDPEQARALLVPACEMYERFHDDQVGSWISCLYYLGFLSAELGDHETTSRSLARAAALGTAGAVPEELAWDDLARGYSLYHRGEHEDALEELRVVRDRFLARTGWWFAQRAAHASLGMGLIEQALGRHRAASVHLEAAASTFEELRGKNQDVEHEQRLAQARVALARSLAELGPAGHARARELLAHAQSWYAKAGGSYAPRIRELARLSEAWATSPRPGASWDRH